MLLVHKAHDDIAQGGETFIDGGGLLEPLALCTAGLLPLAACTKGRGQGGMRGGQQQLQLGFQHMLPELYDTKKNSSMSQRRRTRQVD